MAKKSNPVEGRGVLLPLLSGQLLLPNVAVSEVGGYQEPEPFPDHYPDWMLGQLAWRRQPIPLVSYERLLGFPMERVGHRARVAICCTLNGNTERPYIGILLKSVPRLARVTEETVIPIDEADDASEMVAQQVRINGQDAWIPDLDALESAIAELAQSDT